LRGVKDEAGWAEPRGQGRDLGLPANLVIPRCALHSGLRAITPPSKLVGDPIQSGCACGAAFLARVNLTPTSKLAGDPDTRALPGCG